MEEEKYKRGMRGILWTHITSQLMFVATATTLLVVYFFKSVYLFNTLDISGRLDFVLHVFGNQAV